MCSVSVPKAAAGVDTNGDGRMNFMYLGQDRNMNGIPDALEASIAAPTVTTQVYSARMPVPVAAAGVDVNRDGRANYMVVGQDRNMNGIPDALEARVAAPLMTTQVISPPAPVPVAAAGVDINRDGRANYMVVGQDRNMNGIPDALESPRVVSRMTPMIGSLTVPRAALRVDTNGDGRANMMVIGQDRNMNGIPDALEARIATPKVTTQVYSPRMPVPVAAAGVDVNRDGRANYMVVGQDMNMNGIPDALEARVAAPLMTTQVLPYSPPMPVPVAAAGVDVNRDGRANYMVVGQDRNMNGIPDALESPRVVPRMTPMIGSLTVPRAAASVDTNGDGRANMMFIGQDRNMNGIPDALEAQVIWPTPSVTTDARANMMLIGQDRNMNGIPDALESPCVVPRMTPLNWLEARVSPLVISQAVSPPVLVPVAAAGVDINRDGRANYMYVGQDKNMNGIPDALESPGVVPKMTTMIGSLTVPRAAAGVDTNGDGRANMMVVGQDRNMNGIPDALEARYGGYAAPVVATQLISPPVPVPVAAAGVERRISAPVMTTQLLSPPAPPPVAVAGVDINRDGRANYMYVGQDRNMNGIPDALESPCVVPRMTPMIGSLTVPRAAAGVDTNGDGRANMMVVGQDRNMNGIPDALEARYAAPLMAPRVLSPPVPVPVAAAGVDINRDGRANYMVVGQDRNMNGIPDALESPRVVQRMTPMIGSLTVPRAF